MKSRIALAALTACAIGSVARAGPVTIVDNGNNAASVAAKGVAVSQLSATTAVIVTHLNQSQIYVSHYMLIGNGTGSYSWEYGTGSNCGTGTTVIDGPVNLAAQAGAAPGDGMGVILQPVPAGNDLCLVTTSSANVGGHIAYSQF